MRPYVCCATALALAAVLLPEFAFAQLPPDRATPQHVPFMPSTSPRTTAQTPRGNLLLLPPCGALITPAPKNLTDKARSLLFTPKDAAAHITVHPLPTRKNRGRVSPLKSKRAQTRSSTPTKKDRK